MDNNAAQVIGKKSWVAYFGVAVLAAFLLGGVLPLAFRWNETAALCVLAASGATLFYRIALLRSDQIDRDLLEERARVVLGRVHRNDLVVITGP